MSTRVGTFLFCSLTVFLALSCSSTSGNQQTAVVRLKGQVGDRLTAYAFGGSPLHYGDAIKTGDYDPVGQVCELGLPSVADYRIVLSRNGVPYLETAVTSDMFGLAGGGVIDAGEMSGLTTSLVWGALYDAQKNNKSPSTSLAQIFDRLSAVGEAANMGEVRIADFPSHAFGSVWSARVNLMTVSMARISKGLSGSNPPGSAEVQQLLSFLHSLSDEKASSRVEILREEALSVLPAGAIPSVDSTEISELLLSANSLPSTDVFLSQCHGESEKVVNDLFKLLEL